MYINHLWEEACKQLDSKQNRSMFIKTLLDTLVINKINYKKQIIGSGHKRSPPEDEYEEILTEYVATKKYLHKLDKIKGGEYVWPDDQDYYGGWVLKVNESYALKIAKLKAKLIELER
jgi:hypothetical protein